MRPMPWLRVVPIVLTRTLVPAVLTPTVALLLGATLGMAPAAYAYVPGGGKDADKGNDCLIGYDGITGDDVKLEGKKQVVECTDCDPRCDFDGDPTVNDSCTFKIGVCFNQETEEPACARPSWLDKAAAKYKVKGKGGAKGGGPFKDPTTLASSTCGSFGALRDLTVPLKERKNGDLTPNSATFKLSGRATTAAGKRVDKDKLTYVCLPRTGVCPEYCGEIVRTWGSEGVADGQFSSPLGVATDASGNVYVADAANANSRIQKFDADGMFLTKWLGSIDVASNFFPFAFPVGVAIDASGNVYVAEFNAHRIQKFDANGTNLATWGSYGSADGAFDFPSGVATDASGNVYVADGYNNRIQKFDANGMFLTKWGSSGSADGQFAFPSGVATDASGNLYVADIFVNARIQKFDANGTFLTKWGSEGAAPGQFAAGSRLGSLPHPSGVATDASGNVYVADSYNDRIQKFDANGMFLTKWGSFGSTDGAFNFPVGVATDASGNVYVADPGNHRIQKFACQ